jgi:hypothetical protein
MVDRIDLLMSYLKQNFVTNHHWEQLLANLVRMIVVFLNSAFDSNTSFGFVGEFPEMTSSQGRQTVKQFHKHLVEPVAARQNEILGSEDVEEPLRHKRPHQ